MPSRLRAYLRSVSRTRQRRGFTLIEMLLVILCLAILMTVVTMSLLGSRQSAQDARAKSDVSNSLISARAGSAAAGDYPDEQALYEQLTQDNPSLTFVYCEGHQEGTDLCPGIVMDAKTVYLDLLPAADSGGQGEEVTLCAQSQTQRIYCLRSNEPGNIQGVLEDVLDS